MKILRTIKTAFRSLRRNPMRALLTTLGIVIGVGSVIAMMEIGSGSSAELQKTIAGMGANVLILSPGTASTGGVSFGSGTKMTLTPDDCEAIGRECSSVLAVAPTVHSQTQVVYGSRNWVPSTMWGTTPQFLPIRNLSVAEGQCFTERDVANSAKVCLIGYTLVKELFEGASPVGEMIRVNNVPFRVTGVLAKKGANMMGMDQDDILIAPWTTIKYRVSGRSMSSTNQSSSSGSSSSENTLSDLYPKSSTSLYPERSAKQQLNNPLPVRFTNVDHIVVSAKSPQHIASAIEQINNVLRRTHRIGPGEDDDFSIRDMTEMSNTLSSTTKVMTNLLLCVAMISLVVGGVGIMNIMLVSVTERTHEIGLRMSVGARGRDIMRQFLIEAVVLCLTGGALGIILGHGCSYLVQALLHWPTQTSPGAITASIVVSATVGIVFGYYPAWKASKLDPIEALRYE